MRVVFARSLSLYLSLYRFLLQKNPQLIWPEPKQRRSENKKYNIQVNATRIGYFYMLMMMMMMMMMVIMMMIDHHELQKNSFKHPLGVFFSKPDGA